MADEEATDDVLYGSMRTLVRPKPEAQAALDPSHMTGSGGFGRGSGLASSHAGCTSGLAELAVVTWPPTSTPPQPSTPVPRGVASDAVENSELPVKSVSVDWYSDRGLMRGFDDNATVFCITCNTVVEGCQFKTERRYADFVEFKDRLIDDGLLVTTTSFPARYPLRSLLGGLTDAAKNERAKGLADWMNSVINQSVADAGSDIYVLSETREALRDFLTPQLQAVEEEETVRDSTPRSFVGFGFGADAQSGWTRGHTSASWMVPNQATRVGGSERAGRGNHYALLDELEAGRITQRASW